ncbi:MAG: flagellar motor protein MotB [Allopontixanthobacter sediminis]
MAAALAQSAPAPAAEPASPIIVKKITIVAAGHHGGAWKVAYADFVTAMMAFFLMLWLLGATDETQRKGLADYFTPTLVQYRENSAGSDGLLTGSSLVDVDNYPHAAGQTGTQSLTIPRDTSGGAKEGAMPDSKAIARVKSLREEIARKLAASRRAARLANQVRVMQTPEGIRIDLVDNADFSMFALGTTVLVPDAQELLRVIAESIAGDTAPLAVRGHTDALPWRAGVVANNWSLSTGRAEATRQALMRYGTPQSRFRRIEGVADRELLVTADPADPRNRRISILLME